MPPGMPCICARKPAGARSGLQTPFGVGAEPPNALVAFGEFAYYF